MGEPTFTKGPWTADLSAEHRGSIFAGVDGEEEKIGGFYTDEDAILAAAAPDLFEALKNLVSEIRAYQSPECDDPGSPGAAELAAADAALLKASHGGTQDAG